MNAVAIDTSVLLAIFKGEPEGELWLVCLQSAAESASLLIEVREHRAHRLCGRVGVHIAASSEATLSAEEASRLAK